MNYDIFISYRRNGGYQTAKHLYDLLSRDGYRVSFDIDTLRNGDFDTELLKRIDECTDFILILNEGAFDRTLDPQFDPRKDWLRNELAYALKRGKNIVPVMLSGFTEFPDNLPADVARVQRKNGPKYDQYYFDDFYRRLKTAFLETPCPDPAAVDARVRRLKVSADMAAELFIDGVSRQTMEADRLYSISLTEGTYRVELAALEDASVRLVRTVALEGHDSLETFELLPLKHSQDERSQVRALQRTAVALLERYGGPVVWPDGPTQRRCPYRERGFLVARDGKFGVVKVDGAELIPCLYDGICYAGGFYVVEREKRFGVLDGRGKRLVEMEYERISPSDNEGPWPACKEGRWGYIEPTGRVVIDFACDEARPFIDGIAAVRKHGLWGIIDTRGSLLVKPVYDEVCYGEQWYSEKLIAVAKNGKWGFIDKNGGYVLEPSYKQVCLPFQQGAAVVETRMDSRFIDRQGKLLSKIPQWSGDFYLYTTEGLLPLYKENRFGYIDCRGNEAIPLIYDRVKEGRPGVFCDGLLRLRKNGKWGYVDRQHATVLDFVYDEADDFADGIARVVLNGAEGFIDRQGNFLAAERQEEDREPEAEAEERPLSPAERYLLREAVLERFTEGDSFSARIGYRDRRDGRVVVEPRYLYGPESISGEERAFVLSAQGGEVIDKLGRTEKSYRCISPLKKGLLDTYHGRLFSEGSRYGWTVYSHYGPEFFLVKESETKSIGVIDLHGRTVVPFEYDRFCFGEKLSLQCGELAMLTRAVSGSEYGENYQESIDIWDLKSGEHIPRKSSKLLKKLRSKNLCVVLWTLLFMAWVYVSTGSSVSVFRLWEELSGLWRTLYAAGAAAGVAGLLVQAVRSVTRFGRDTGIYPTPVLLIGAFALWRLALLADLPAWLRWLRIGGYVVLGIFVLLSIGMMFAESENYRRISK